MPSFKGLAALAATFSLRRDDHARSAGCGGEAPDFIGETREFTIESSGGTREYRVYLPSNYDPNIAAPLLIAYHGAGGVASEFQEFSHFSDEELNPNMISVYPTGVNATWEGPSYAVPGVSDLTFTTDLVNRLKEDFCIDEDRVRAAGYSNGGGFVNTLACSNEHGGQFAGFAAFAAALYTDDEGEEGCNPARSPMPIFEIHGTGDDTIPYEGGEGRGGNLPDIDEWVMRWRNRNQAPASSTRELPNGVHEIIWGREEYGTVVRHFKLDGHDHGFPGVDDEQIYVSPYMLDFLKEKVRP